MTEDPRPTCPACALKHISAAIAWEEFLPIRNTILTVKQRVSFCLCKAFTLQGEFLEGYKGHDLLAQGWVAVAEDLQKTEDAGAAELIRTVRKMEPGRASMKILMDYIGQGMDFMGLAHLTEARAEGNMEKDAPELAAKLTELLRSYDPELARKLMMEYRKLYEL